MQIFLFKQTQPNPLNSEHLLSVTKMFSQFSLKCLLEYFFFKNCWQNLAKASLLYLQWTATIHTFWRLQLQILLDYFCNCYLATLRPTFNHFILTIWLGGHREPFFKTYFKKRYFDTSISNYFYINRFFRVFLALVLHV